MYKKLTQGASLLLCVILGTAISAGVVAMKWSIVVSLLVSCLLPACTKSSSDSSLGPTANDFVGTAQGPSDPDLSNLPNAGGHLFNPDGAATPTGLGLDPTDPLRPENSRYSQDSATRLGEGHSLMDLVTQKEIYPLFGFSKKYLNQLLDQAVLTESSAATIPLEPSPLPVGGKCRDVASAILSLRGLYECEVPPELTFDKAVQAFYGAQQNTPGQAGCRAFQNTGVAIGATLTGSFAACVAKGVSTLSPDAVDEGVSTDLAKLYVQTPQTYTTVIVIPSARDPRLESLEYSSDRIFVRVLGKEASAEKYVAEVTGCRGSNINSHYTAEFDYRTKELALKWSSGVSTEPRPPGPGAVTLDLSERVMAHSYAHSTPVEFSFTSNQYYFHRSEARPLKITSQESIQDPKFDFMDRSDVPQDELPEFLNLSLELTLPGRSVFADSRGQLLSRKSGVTQSRKSLGLLRSHGLFSSAATATSLPKMGWTKGVMASYSKGFTLNPDMFVKVGMSYQFDPLENLYVNTEPSGNDAQVLTYLLRTVDVPLTSPLPIQQPLPSVSLCNSNVDGLRKVMLKTTHTKVAQILHDCTSGYARLPQRYCDVGTSVSHTEKVIASTPIFVNSPPPTLGTGIPPPGLEGVDGIDIGSANQLLTP